GHRRGRRRGRAGTGHRSRPDPLHLRYDRAAEGCRGQPREPDARAGPAPRAAPAGALRALPARVADRHQRRAEHARPRAGRPASLGQPASGGDLRIADEHGQPVPAGTVGEVWLRAPATRTYYGDRAATAEAFRAGWVRMGDLGYLDADGYLYLVDRDSDVIK